MNNIYYNYIKWNILNQVYKIVSGGGFSEYYINIVLKVSYFRKKAGLTQEQLAERMGVATSFIGQIEAPNIVKAISLDTLFRIAKVLDVMPYKFLIMD